MWISLKAIKHVVDNNQLNLEIIVNNKTSETGEKVIQLETAVGMFYFMQVRLLNTLREVME